MQALGPLRDPRSLQALLRGLGDGPLVRAAGWEAWVRSPAAFVRFSLALAAAIGLVALAARAGLLGPVALREAALLLALGVYLVAELLRKRPARLREQAEALEAEHAARYG